ncbi:MAG: putative thiamine-phosphate synthase [Rhodothermaceae bacterium]|nr:MAG: putative thiamine-phosphate synthase [Rhodothermaceae bacterium]
MQGPGFSYYLITDRKRTRERPLVEVVDRACRSGIRAVQLREKDLPGRALYALAKDLRAVTAAHGALFFVNDRLDVALAAGADGVHCPEAGLRPSDVRALAPALRVGVSVHSVEAARRAREDGATFLLFGPVYATPSKRKYGAPQGLDRLRAVVAAVDIPVLAVGGVTPARARACLDAGAAGIAGISSVLGAASVEDQVRAWRAVLGTL